ncbi:hypothetical protein [Herminiimonas contaminans]|uniref:Secreted protein with PEP-CTERM sorting signal n=1 Tax=Herminiimonas contaminans TaxID=1111140 RepID=A0ABS0EXY6_9BURK|nr:MULTISPECIES: hypothetical protein [Oxalobacteraceae]MBF8179721.1 hypothetical protein [Herminiimonas contaminans]
MFVENKWVPMDLANTLIGVSIIIAAIIFGALIWFGRSGTKSSKQRNEKQHKTPRKRRKLRKKN